MLRTPSAVTEKRKERRGGDRHRWNATQHAGEVGEEARGAVCRTSTHDTPASSSVTVVSLAHTQALSTQNQCFKASFNLSNMPWAVKVLARTCRDNKLGTPELEAETTKIVSGTLGPLPWQMQPHKA